MIDSTKVIEIFNNIFQIEYKTILMGGASEPFYKAADDKNDLNIIYFRENIIQSALHEIAHWCIAGTDRRLKDDYGYWYTPDTRSTVEQCLFYSVEVEPQALEKVFTETCQMNFSPSLDVFSNDMDIIKHETENFISKVNARSMILKSKLPYRASIFNKGLKHYVERAVLS